MRAESIRTPDSPVAGEADLFRWYALRVRSNCERKVANLLRSTDLEEFFPSYRQRSYWSDRMKWIERPLFPGYVFCRFDIHQLRPVIQTPGVVEAVNFGLGPVPVDEGEMKTLQALVGAAVPIFPRAFLHVGQRVTINRGPLAGLEGILERFERECRIVISVTLLQRSISAEIDAEWISEVR